MASQPVSASGNIAPAIAAAGQGVANRMNVREQRDQRAQQAQQFERSAAQRDRQLTEAERANQAGEAFRQQQADEGKRQFDTQFAENQRQFNVSDQNEKNKIANEQQHRQFMQQQSKRVNDMNIAVQKLEIAMTQATGQERQRLAKELLQKRQELAEIEKQTGIANTLQGRTVSEIKKMKDQFSDKLAKMANAETTADETATNILETTDSQLNSAINKPLERDNGIALINLINTATGEVLIDPDKGVSLTSKYVGSKFGLGAFAGIDERIREADPKQIGVQVEASKAVITPVVQGLVESLGLHGKQTEIVAAIEGAFRSAAGLGGKETDDRFTANAKENIQASFDTLEKLGVSRMQMSSMFEQLQIKMNQQSSNIIDSINEDKGIFDLDLGNFGGSRELARFWGTAMEGVGDNIGLLVGELRGTFPSAKTMAPLMDTFDEVLGGTRRGGDMEVLQQFFGGEDFATLEDQFGDLDQDALMRLIEQERAGIANIEDLVGRRGDAAFAVETARSDPGRDLLADPDLKALYEGVMGQ